MARMPERHSPARELGLALAITSAFFVIEVAGGLLTGSLALLADAGHMLTDAGALGLALFALWISRRPITTRRSYGYYRMEILAALVNGVALVLIALYIFWEAIERLQHPPEVHSLPMLAVASLGLLANLATLAVLGHESHANLNVRAALHSRRSDAADRLVSSRSAAFHRYRCANPLECLGPGSRKCRHSS